MKRLTLREGVILLSVFLIVLLSSYLVASAASADKWAQWRKSGHANRELAVEEATVENRQAFAAHCARCHAEQGFLAWLPQLQKGNPGLIQGPGGTPATVGYLSMLGLNKFTVRPQTCTTCHNADFTLRVTGSTPLLPAGFKAEGVGEGALCMTCHNTRNGKIVWNDPDPKRWTAPHTASQADVIMSKNAYFLNYEEMEASPHAAFTGDACVTCHVKLNPESHTFKAQRTVCTNCHGPNFTADAVQKPIRALLHEVEEAIARRVLAAREKIATIRAWDPKTDQYTPNFPVRGADIVKVELEEIHGQQGLKFVLRDGRELYSQLGDVKDAAGKPVFPTSDVIVRAGWNYWLIEGDDSFGVHNPSFARAVLLRTLEALK